ncbi:helix-turn-helix domain-containing protein [Ramlibacter sp. GTP1]|uniref:Helix-turn-helix domain-containing protein n=2 Tax=Ramlibacter albus TaxID=2079448 RepID=A0A923M854_9BURK|nr:helix-turn-helix domain-containing protein [Ramlibacter albus]
MKVLTAFDGSKRHLSLSEIAAITELDNSAAQRFTHTLSALGYLVKDPETRKYELSVRLLDFTYHYLASSELVQRTGPVLQKLARDTEEVCNLTVPDGADIVFVLRYVSRNVMNPNVIVGTRLPSYCTAPGLAILSTWSDEEVDAVLAASRLVKHTPNTITDPRRIKSRLAKIRAAGYAHTQDELYADDISTAAPILDAHGRAIGALNIAVSRARWDEAKDEQRYATVLREAAATVSAPRLPHRAPAGARA